PGVALEAAERKGRGRRHGAGERQRGLAGPRPGPAAADIDVDQDPEHVPGGAGRAREVPHVVWVVDHDEHTRVVVEEAYQPADLLVAHDLGGDQEAGDPRGRHHLRLRELGADDARRTRGDLAPRDLRALVGLGVRAELLARGRHVRGRGTEVPVEAVEVEEKGGGGDFVAGHGADSSTPPAAPGLSIAGRVRYHL